MFFTCRWEFREDFETSLTFGGLGWFGFDVELGVQVRPIRLIRNWLAISRTFEPEEKQKDVD